MKKDQYIPHEVCSRSNSQVINLIETEGMAGYGIYWALLEYLRVQDNYIGEIKALASLRRQLKIRKAKLDKVLTEFGLFVCNADTFYSPKLNELMKPFEERRARIDAFKRKKEKSNSLEISDNSNPTCDIISFEGKGEGKGKEETSSPISSSSAEAVAEAAPVFHESWTASSVMSACWATKGRFFRPVRRSVTSASTSTRVVLPSNAYGRNCINPSTKGHISTKITILPQGSAAIAGCRYRPMLRQGRMCKRCGVKESGCTDFLILTTKYTESHRVSFSCLFLLLLEHPPISFTRGVNRYTSPKTLRHFNQNAEVFYSKRRSVLKKGRQGSPKYSKIKAT